MKSMNWSIATVTIDADIAWLNQRKCPKTRGMMSH